MRHFKAGLALTLVAALLAACGGGGSGSSSSSSSGGAVNTPPTANAGSAQTVNAGTTVTLNGSASSDPDGSIASYAWTQTAGTAVTLTSNSSAQPSFTAPAVSAVTVFTFSLVVTDNRGATSTASTVDITVNPVIGGTVTFSGVVQFARVNFTSTFPRPLNYANPVNRPARGVLVRALTAGTTTERANAITGDDGSFSMSLPANTSIDIQVVARMQRAGSPSWDVRVQDGTTGNTPYTYTPPTPFSSSVGSSQTINVPLGITGSGTATGAGVSTRYSGPFAILDTLYTAIQGVRAVAPNTSFPALIVDWGTQQDGTFFSSGPVQHIALLSDITEDTDEFDQHVIAHEFGHYIEHNFSRADNIGGSHAIGEKIDPRVAFGEGWGYAFAAMVLNDPDARDSFFGDITPNDGMDNPVHASGGFNIETNPTGSNGCWCSESSVYSILYDLYDGGADTNDTVSLGLQPIWNVLTTTQKNTPAFTTIFSFIAAIKSDQAASAAAINTLVAAQNIDAGTIDAFATTETHFPSLVPQAAALPVYTAATISGGPYVLRNVDDAGHYNKLGNHRFLRLTATSTRTVTITATSSNTNTPDVDFRVYHLGDVVAAGEDPSSENPESESLAVTNGQTYIIDVYDCANGCDTTQGTAGDYNLAVNIN